MENQDSQYKEIFEKSPIGILFYDKEGKLTDANQSALEIFGIPSLNDCVGLSLFDNPDIVFRKEELLNDGLIRFQATINFDIIKELGLYNPKKSGNSFIDYTVSVTDYGYLVQVQDITEHKITKDKFFESQEEYKSLFENSMDAVLLTVPDGSVLAANPAAEEIFGYGEGEICKLGRNGLVDTTDPRLAEGLKERERTGKVKGELTYIRSDGSKFEGEVSTSIFKDKNGNPRTVMVIRDITQRKKDEEEIKYQANLLNNVSDPIIATDLNCIITSWNKAAEGLYGYKTEESIGKLVKDVINSEFTNEQRKKALNCLNKGHSCPLELTQYAKDGKILYIESTTLPIYERDKVTGYVSVNHDITQHRKAEEVLKIKEEQLRISLEAAHAGMWIRDPIGEWIATPELNALFGRSIDDPPLLEEEFIDYIHPDDLPRIEKTWLSARNGESVYDEEYRVIWPDGSLHWLASKGKISSQEGMPRFIGITYDITQHKKAEEELKQAHDTLELKVQERTVELENAYDDLFDLYNNAPCGYHSLDKDAYFERINDTELSWLGYSREEIVGKKKFTDLITEESLKTFKKNYPSFIKKGYVNDLEFDMIRKDGSILPILLNATAIYDPNGNFLMSRSTLFDMTEHKKAEEELKRSNKELQQFAYVSSHDLQEPLRTIASFTQLLERRYKGQLDDNADEFMNYIVDATIRMNEQIQGLLEFSRVGTKDVKFEPVDMNLILNQTIQNLNLSIREANTEITHDELPTVIGNARQLQRVFQNLISNAIKFKKPDGSSKIHISAYKSEDGKEYVFSVKDNGIGIEEKYFDRIFTIFQQLHTRDEYDGTGIGLSIVKKIIERHGGRMWVESEFGKGSTFYFTIHVSNRVNAP